MNHDKCQALIADYVVNGLSEQQASEVESHLLHCDDCNAHMTAQIQLMDLGREFKDTLWPEKPQPWPARAASGLRSFATMRWNLRAVPVPLAAAVLLGLLGLPVYLLSVTIPALQRAHVPITPDVQSLHSVRLGGHNVINVIILKGEVVPIEFPLAKPRDLDGVYVIEIRTASRTDVSYRIPAASMNEIWDSNKAAVVLRVPTAAITPGEHRLFVRELGQDPEDEIPFTAALGSNTPGR